MKHNKEGVRMLQVFACICLIASLLFSGAGIIYAQPPGCTAYEYCETDCPNATYVYDSYWRAQTFTAISDHDVHHVALLIFKEGDPGKLTVSIRNTSGGEPIGPDLGAAADILPEEISATDHPGEWVGTSIDAVSLVSGTTYALVVRSQGANMSNCIRWCIGTVSSSNPSPMGPCYGSSDSGSSWTIHDTDSRNGFRLAECPDEEEPPVDAVGGEAYPVSKIAILAPWIAMVMLIAAGAFYLVRRRVNN
jgi:hypothetical protein